MLNINTIKKIGFLFKRILKWNVFVAKQNFQGNFFSNFDGSLLFLALKCKYFATVQMQALFTDTFN